MCLADYQGKDQSGQQENGCPDQGHGNGAEIDPNFFENMESEDKAKRKLTESLNTGVMLTLMGIGFILFAALDFYSFSQWGYLAGVVLLCVGISSLVSFFFGLRYKAPEKPSCGQTDGNGQL